VALTGTAVLVGIGPIGWFVLGFVLIGGSMVLSRAGDAAKDSAIEKWLDASSFGMRELPDAPRYANLNEEVTALGIALHNPQVVETDWSRRWGFDHYQAEAEIFLPGYDFGESILRITANGQSVAPVKRHQQDSGTTITLRYYLSKKEDIERVVFNVRYRPNASFNKDFSLTITLPEPENPEIDEQTIS